MRADEGRRKQTSPWKTLRLFFLYLGLVCLLMLVIGRIFPPTVPHRKIECMNNLRILGGLLQKQRPGGKEIYEETGSKFLLQAAPEASDDHLYLFLCVEDERYSALRSGYGFDKERLSPLFREDWRTAPCSFRGPDKWLLERLRSGAYAREKVIIACDMNGLDGRSPHHIDGVVCLWNTTRITFMEWDQMEGYDGDIVPVGPDSPDPRFQHLVP